MHLEINKIVSNEFKVCVLHEKKGESPLHNSWNSFLIFICFKLIIKSTNSDWLSTSELSLPTVNSSIYKKRENIQILPFIFYLISFLRLLFI